MVAVITGAGRGLGQAVAEELAQHGWDLALLARTASQLDAVAEQARSRGVRAETFPASADDEAEVRDAFAGIHAAFGRIDALVHCAGIGSFAPVLEADATEWARILNVNVFGTFLCCREAARVMAQQRSGHIINVLSIAAKTVFPGSSAYCASKWGALALTKALAAEIRTEGVKVTAFSPGSIHTPFWDQISHPFDVHDMLPPEDVAATIRFLLEQPPTIYTDEMVVMPPKGIL